jgi:hypothetical protein
MDGNGNCDLVFTNVGSSVWRVKDNGAQAEVVPNGGWVIVTDSATDKSGTLVLANLSAGSAFGVAGVQLIQVGYYVNRDQNADGTPICEAGFSGTTS